MNPYENSFNDFERLNPKRPQPEPVSITQSNPDEIHPEIKAACARLLEKAKTVKIVSDSSLADSQQAKDTETLKKNSHVPERHWNAKNLDRLGPWGRVESTVLGKLGSGFTMALIGLRGPGKTQIGVEAIRANLTRSNPRSSLYLTATEFFMRVKEAYKTDAKKTELEIMTELRRCRLMVIDELSKRSESDWENRLLFELLDRRYLDGTDTILLANADPKQFSECLGDSIVDRINQSGGIVECKWASYRAQK